MLKQYPITDLHRHLDGTIRADTILELGRKFNVNLPANTLEALIPHVQITKQEPNLVAFLSKLDWGVNVLGDYDACARVAEENVEDLVKAQIDYAELRFSPGYMAMSHKLKPEGVVEAVIEGVRRGMQKHDVQVNLIGIMSRTFGQQSCSDELAACMAFRDQIVAVDLAGDELGYPGNLFVEQFSRARDAGFAITVHAGEAAGPVSVWQAIRELGATRIGHGVKIAEDPELMEYVAKHKIGVESCLSSNFQTNTTPDLSQHPLKRFLEHGIRASLNTDDPGVSAIDLPDEYRIAREQLGFGDEQIAKLQSNGLKMAFISESARQALREKASKR
ncbi:adenosine deaminase [Agarivorans sp. Alg241-V36]|uniref:adenosine deaminase n=1 Tax=Agarivorans sp. Alg241-V36 TaxID=2305992 RepID=UPI0013D57B8F|nr:adenosine deaminase [Agarivorans sp. Alg241-V36]